MPLLSTRFIRISLVYLALGFTLGAVLMANKALAFYPLTWRLLPIHIEVLLMGWFVQLAVGVAYWILPRLSGPQPRGNERLVWLSFWMVNLGIWLIIIEAIAPLQALSLAGRLVELGGVAVFILGSWKRVRSFSS